MENNKNNETFFIQDKLGINFIIDKCEQKYSDKLDPFSALCIEAENERKESKGLFKSKKKNETITFLGFLQFPVIGFQFKKNYWNISFIESQSQLNKNCSISILRDINKYFENFREAELDSTDFLQSVLSQLKSTVKEYKYSFSLFNNEKTISEIVNLINMRPEYKYPYCMYRLSSDEIERQLIRLKDFKEKFQFALNWGIKSKSEISLIENTIESCLAPIEDKIIKSSLRYEKLFTYYNKIVRDLFSLDAESLSKEMDEINLYYDELEEGYKNQKLKTNDTMSNMDPYYIKTFKATHWEPVKGNPSGRYVDYAIDRPLTNFKFFKKANEYNRLCALVRNINYIREFDLCKVKEEDKKNLDFGVDYLNYIIEMAIKELRLLIRNRMEIRQRSQKIIDYINYIYKNNLIVISMIKNTSILLQTKETNNYDNMRDIKLHFVTFGISQYESSESKRWVIFSPRVIESSSQEKKKEKKFLSIESLKGKQWSILEDKVKSMISSNNFEKKNKGINLLDNKEFINSSYLEIHTLLKSDMFIAPKRLKKVMKWLDEWRKS
ncbi:MAG: hypothetical protein K8S23_10850 [Candidatus Cloacimonetes bacterium]|nr:hypothetical protein [Candidatus Cloacimonadota bacterium]